MRSNRSKSPRISRGFLAAVFVTGLLCVRPTPLLAGGAKITIVNMDGPNVGLNDPTPAAPVGSNTNP